MGNITPLISVEGSEIVSDERRGKSEVLSKTLRGVQNCLDARLLTGVCTSLCQSNIDDLLTEKWLDRLIDMGVMYTWFHTYRPVGPEPNEQLALTPEQQLRIRKFVVEMRAKKPIAIIDAYYDYDGNAVCPAATGISHHISPWGDIEPCPIVQFAKENYRQAGSSRNISLEHIFKDFSDAAASSTRGCIVLERPDLLKGVVDKHQAADTTVRKTAMAAVGDATSTESIQSSEKVPEKSLAYKLAKRLFYHDFGAYDGKDLG